MILDNEFKGYINQIDTERLNLSHDCIYILNKTFNIVGFNEAYIIFAADNGLPEIEFKFGLGTNIFNVIPEVLRNYYHTLWINALKRNKMAEYDYECSSPDKYRKYHQTAYPIINSTGLIITNHCVYEEMSSNLAVLLMAHHFNDKHNLEQCINCRKIKDQSVVMKWDWVPELVKKQHPNTEHSFCDYCLEHFYPGIDPESWHNGKKH